MYDTFESPNPRSAKPRTVSGHFMRRLLIIPYILASLASSGQSCETIDGQTINCSDNINQKQGFWKERKIILTYCSYSCFGNNNGCKYKEENVYVTLAEGEYKDNKKIGKWKFYDDNNNTSTFKEEVTFAENGRIYVNNISDKYFIEFNKDSTELNGYIKYQEDTISVICINKKCAFKLNSNEEFITFDYLGWEKVEYEFLRLKIGMYDRKLYEYKTNR